VSAALCAKGLFVLSCYACCLWYVHVFVQAAQQLCTDRQDLLAANRLDSCGILIDCLQLHALPKSLGKLCGLKHLEVEACK
jgi:hypothetical protein